jgi:hypothetical protein
MIGYSMNPTTTDTPFTAAESRTMLAHLLAIVTGIFFVAELVIFIWFRWMKVRLHDPLFGDWIEVGINPWLIWIPVGMVMLAVMWWAACRKHSTRWQLPVILIAVMLGWSLTGWTATMKKPYNPHQKPEGPFLPDKPLHVPFGYPFLH